MSDRKTITLRETAYDALAEAKREGESFSDAVERLTDAPDEPDGEHTPNTVAVENVEEIARAAATEVENRMTRR